MKNIKPITYIRAYQRILKGPIERATGSQFGCIKIGVVLRVGQGAIITKASAFIRSGKIRGPQAERSGQHREKQVCQNTVRKNL